MAWISSSIANPSGRRGRLLRPPDSTGSPVRWGDSAWTAIVYLRPTVCSTRIARGVKPPNIRNISDRLPAWQMLSDPPTSFAEMTLRRTSRPSTSIAANVYLSAHPFACLKYRVQRPFMASFGNSHFERPTSIGCSSNHPVGSGRTIFPRIGAWLR
jgi:hypothetical protein